MNRTKIITLTGPSGAGKTSVAEKMMELSPNVQMVLSRTTRRPRVGDLSGEYAYVQQKGLTRANAFLCGRYPNLFQKLSPYLWIVKAHGNIYGTRKSDVDEALGRVHPSIMILVPEVVPKLRYYAEGKLSGSVISFFVSSNASLLQLRNRGDTEGDIERRIFECSKWKHRAKLSDAPFEFIENPYTNPPGEGISETAQHILDYIYQSKAG